MPRANITSIVLVMLYFLFFGWYTSCGGPLSQEEVEAYMALALTHNTLGRFALDFLVWHSVEFDFIRLPDRHSITSSIAPQMRIPYVLEFIHGISGLVTGRLMEALAVNKTASDQLEPATLLPAEFWGCVDESRRAVETLCDVLRNLQVNAERMRALANAHWCQAGTLIAHMVKERGMSFRTAHQILARLSQKVTDGRIPPQEVTVEMVDEAARAHTGEPLGLNADDLRRALNAWTGVEERKYRAGTAPASPARQVRERRCHPGWAPT